VQYEGDHERGQQAFGCSRGAAQENYNGRRPAICEPAVSAGHWPHCETLEQSCLKLSNHGTLQRMRMLLLTLLAYAGTAAAQNASAPSDPTSPWPTLQSISIDWPLSGDANNNSVVSVRYRKQNTSDWREALPLRRVPSGSNEGFSWANRHSGSIFDLEPGTAWEVELSLTDPEGGSTTRTLSVSTRSEPQAFATGRLRSVTPTTVAATINSLEPGDVVVFTDGVYGAISINADGTEQRPITLRSETPFKATVRGNLELFSRKHLIVEGFRIEGTVRVNDAEFITLRRNAIVTKQSGITGYGQPQGILVLDNVITGATVWAESSLGVNGNNVGEGIELTGPGHVICHNQVAGFRDAISTLEGSEAKNQQSVDICNNDIDTGADDAIEADFTMGNVRVMRNLIRNSFVGISGQPTLGGPLYAIRNVMQNIVYSPFKLHRGSVGDVALHNTVIKCGDAFAVYAGVPWSQAFFRNNLFIGGVGGRSWGGFDNGKGDVLQLPDAQPSCSFDYDGFASVGTGTFAGRIGATRFANLNALKSSTTEAHAVQVDVSIFASAVSFPSNGPFPAQASVDLRLAPGTAAVDVGVALANVNTGFAGVAPDLGAYEVGSNLPVYGPRPTGLPAVCGNGLREGTEGCDDNNTVSGDGCSASCEREMPVAGAGGGTSNSGGGNTSSADGGIGSPEARRPCGCQLTSRDGSFLLLALALLHAARRRQTSTNEAGEQ
jgi:cysteine-rich repeat protein